MRSNSLRFKANDAKLHLRCDVASLHCFLITCRDVNEKFIYGALLQHLGLFSNFFGDGERGSGALFIKVIQKNLKSS